MFQSHKTVNLFEQSPEHEAECVVLSRARSCISINDMSKSHPVYQCITPLRGILLKNTQPKLFEVFGNRFFLIKDFQTELAYQLIGIQWIGASQ